MWIAKEGPPPGIRRFAAAQGVTQEHWKGRLWPSWSAFLAEAGAEAAALKQPITEDDLFLHLANLTRELGRFPPPAQLKYSKSVNPDSPSETTLRARLGRVDEMVAALLTWVRGREEWRDVEALLSARVPKAPAVAPALATTREAVQDPLAESHIPPVIAGLAKLASGGDAIKNACAARGLALSVEFERRVQIALELLGFQVERLGQGAGRKADGIARWPQARWAVIYDAKVRRDGYAMGTEDRKFREYIETHGPDLVREGFERLYFAVISSSFREVDIAKSRDLVGATVAKPCALIPVEVLTRAVELKLRSKEHDAAWVERAFRETAIVTSEWLR